VKASAPELAIIIVGYNSQEYIDECFASLHKSSYKSFTIFYIENSQDGSAEFIKKKYPNTVVFAETKNQGFAVGNNIGITAALKQNFKYIFLLNPDTVVKPDCLQELMDAASPKTILQPLILLEKEGVKTTQVNTAGNILSYLGFSYCGGYMEEAATFKGKAEITVASGAGVFFPAEALRKLEGFDPLYFMYHEDVDLSWRARKAGYDLFLLPSAQLWHKYSFSRNDTKFFYSERNRLLFILKNFSWLLLTLSLPFHIVNELLLCLFALIGGWLPAKLRGYGSLIKLFPTIMRSRGSARKTQVRSEHQLKHLLSASIRFSEVKVPLIGVYNFFAGAYWLLISWLI